jgi:hypothetical protein
VILEAVGKPHVTLPKPHRLSTTPAHDKVSLSTSCLHWARELATMGNNRTYAPPHGTLTGRRIDPVTG